MESLLRIGLDTSKSFFQLHGVNAAEQPVLRKMVRRQDLMGFFRKLAPTEVGMEACGASHHWARELTALGHRVKLIAPQLAKPYVKRGKNDAADAEALCEAMSRPTMRFVPVKTADQQAALMLVGMREQLVGQRVQLANAIRGTAAEFGHVAPKGVAHLEPLLAEIAADAAVPAVARALFALQRESHRRLVAEIATLDRKLLAWHRDNALSRKLRAIPSVGAVIAAVLVMKTPDPAAFRSGRDYAAWLGLTPRDHSTAGKTRSGAITRAGDATLRSLLVSGATAVIQQRQRGRGRTVWPWLDGLIARKPGKLAAVALANKVARIAWKLMTSGESYDPGRRSAAAGGGKAEAAAPAAPGSARLVAA